MKKNSAVIITFCTIAAVLAVVLVFRIFFIKDKGTVHPKVINPVVSSESSNELSENAIVDDSAVQTSFIPLLPTETLMSTLTLDFDGDNLDDQVVA